MNFPMPSNKTIKLKYYWNKLATHKYNWVCNENLLRIQKTNLKFCYKYDKVIF